jgi:cytochrome P450
MLSLLAIGLTLLVSTILWFLMSSKKSSKSAHLLKSAPGFPILGNALSFLPENIITTMAEFPSKYGKFIEIYFFSQRGLLITDPEICKEVLSKRPKTFRRTSLMVYANEVLGTVQGLFASEGTSWIKMRKSTAPSFSNLNISHKYASMTKEILLWIDSLLKKSVHTSVDMKKESFNLTIRIITIVAFGLDVSDPLCSYFFTDFSSDILDIFQFLGDATLFPFPRFLWKYSPQYKSEIAVRKALARFTVACQKIIDSKRSLAKEGKLPMNCMIDSLIANTTEGTANSKGLSDEEISANIKTFFIAGADTTAITLSWMMYHFAINPNFLLKIQEETKSILFPEGNVPTLSEFIKNEKLISSFDMNQFKGMTFTNAFIKETLRLYAAGSFVFLETLEKDGATTLSNGIQLDSKEIVMLNTDGLSLDPEVFLSPTEFQPERWLTEDKERLHKMELTFFPFGGGPRACPGMNLSLNEAALAISLLSLYGGVMLDCPKEEISKIYTFVSVPNKMPVKFYHLK